MNTKSVFAIRMSEDGNAQEVFTNIKALYAGIVETGYECENIRVFDGDLKTKSVPFNYANLVKVVRISQDKNRFVMCYMECARGSQIEIQQMIIRSK